MSNLVESLQMCLWFDVNTISRRNLLAAIVSSIAVSEIFAQFANDSSQFLRLCCYRFSSSVLGGLSLELQRRPRKKVCLISATTSVGFSAQLAWSWLTLSPKNSSMEALHTKVGFAPVTVSRSGCLLASSLASLLLSPAYGFWSPSSLKSFTSKASESFCKTFSSFSRRLSTNSAAPRKADLSEVSKSPTATKVRLHSHWNLPLQVVEIFKRKVHLIKLYFDWLVSIDSPSACPHPHFINSPP